MAIKNNPLKNAIAMTVRPFAGLIEDPLITEKPLWIDVSKHQGKMNFQIAKDLGVWGVVARATVSWGYVDPMFQRFYADAKTMGFYRSSYHVLYPGQPMLTKGYSRGQIDNWYQMHPTLDVVPRVLDVELSLKQSWQRIAEDTWKAVEIIYRRDGIHPIIYTRNLLARDWLERFWDSAQMNAVWWWMAQYHKTPGIEHAGPPDFPSSIKKNRVILQQTTDSKVLDKRLSESYATDINRWQLGNSQEMVQWINENWGSDTPIPDDETNPEETETWNDALQTVIGFAKGEMK